MKRGRKPKKVESVLINENETKIGLATILPATKFTDNDIVHSNIGLGTSMPIKTDEENDDIIEVKHQNSDDDKTQIVECREDTELEEIEEEIIEQEVNLTSNIILEVKMKNIKPKEYLNYNFKCPDQIAKVARKFTIVGA